jgi:glycosyltransferase involved in cell wall biosynthesis
MKVLQTPVRFHPYTGGVENYVHGLSKELVKKGHEVTVLCAGEGGGNGSVDGIAVKRLGYAGKIANTNVTPMLPVKMMGTEYDIVHTHLPTPWSADWSAIACAAKRKPLVLTYHNDVVGRGAAGYLAGLYNGTMMRFVLKKADRIIVTHAGHLENPVLKGYSRKVEVIPVGVDLNRFKPADVQVRRDTLFFLSVLDAFHQYKGVDYLLYAIKKVKKQIPGVKLIVGGSGRLQGYYMNAAETLGLSGNVEFLGSIPDEEIVRHYNMCEAFVLPSTSGTQEGYGMVLLEAMACGRPVITTHITGAAQEIEERKAGLVVPPKDADKLAEAIVTLLSDKESAKKMGRNARRLVEERYSWKKISGKVEEVYLSI